MKTILSKILRSSIGCFLIVLGLLSGVFSTYATIIPISLSFKGLTKSIMIGIFIIVQISVFFLAMTKNYIAKETPQHFLLINRIANMLMLVSIISTITFFNMSKSNIAGHKESIIDLYKIIPFLDVLPFYNWIISITVNVVFVWSVCIILDVLAIKMPLIGFDIMMGIKEKINHATTLSKIFTILSYKPKAWINDKYNSLGLEENCNQESEDYVVKIFEQNADQSNINQIAHSKQKLLEDSTTDPEETEEKLFEKKVLNLENLKKVFEYIINNLKPNDMSQGIKKISDNTGFTVSEVTRIRKKLIEHDYLLTDGNETKVIKQELNLEDFEEENDNE